MENLASVLRWVLLKVDGQTYALHLDAVDRVLRMAEITPLPGAPDAVEGVINIQGEVVSIVSIRRRLGLAERTVGIAIGASTGGPPVLQTILAALPQDFPVPILIVQHMAAGFTQGFVQWLAQTSSLPVHLATHDEHIRAGHVYVAPDEFQMWVERGGKIVLTKDEPENGLRPSVSYLLRSVAEVYGRDAVAGLLTGMGHDGAEELKLLKEKGAVTFAQDKDSSVVHGMPGAAIKLDAATFVLPPEKIAAVLTNLVHNEK